MSKLIETTTAQKIFKSMIDLNLDKDEVIYFEEFINLLYEGGVIKPRFSGASGIHRKQQKLFY